MVRWAWAVSLVLLPVVARGDAACHGSVHYVVRDEQGGILDPDRLASLDAEPPPAIEALALETMPHRLGTQPARALRLGGCAFEGDLVLRLGGQTMELQFRNLAELNDVAYEVDGLPFRQGRFRLDFGTVSGPLVPSTAWRRVEGDDPSGELLGRLEAQLQVALNDRDVPALERLVAADASIVVGEERLARPELIARVRELRPYQRFASSFETVLVTGGDALVASGVSTGFDPLHPSRLTRVWGRRDGRWQVVSHHEHPALRGFASRTVLGPGTIGVPAGWSVDVTAVELQSEDGEARLHSWLLPDRVVTDHDRLLREVRRKIQDPRVDIGPHGDTASGHGIAGGRAARWIARLLPGPRPLLVLAWAPTDAWFRHEGVLRQLLDDADLRAE